MTTENTDAAPTKEQLKAEERARKEAERQARRDAEEAERARREAEEAAREEHVRRFRSSRNNIHIIVDSCGDFDPAIARALDVEVIGFPYVVDGEERVDDLFQTVSAREFYDSMRHGTYPTTSAVTPGHYHEIFKRAAEEGRPTIYLAFTEALSSSVRAAEEAAQMVRDEYPDFRIAVVDNRCPSSAASTARPRSLAMWRTLKPGFQSPSSILGAKVSSARVAPMPEPTISQTSPTGRPWARANATASQAPAMAPASETWLQSLAAWPAPGRPNQKMRLEKASRAPSSGAAWASVAPAMRVRVPASAPSWPPVTGQSKAVTSMAAAASESSRASSGRDVVRSTRNVPGSAADSRPSGPR